MLVLVVLVVLVLVVLVLVVLVLFLGHCRITPDPCCQVTGGNGLSAPHCTEVRSGNWYKRGRQPGGGGAAIRGTTRDYSVRADLGWRICFGLKLTGLGVKGTGNDGNKVRSRGTGGVVEGAAASSPTAATYA